MYSYDKLNRLTNGSSPTSGMSEILNYDDMGNITHLTRDGSGISYSYTGNRLHTVSGLINGSYSYDENGNAKTDRMGMSLSYNYLNLPQQVTGGGNTITYLYDAGGNKLRKTANTSGQRDYTGGIEYQNGVMELIHTAEGIAYRNANGTYSYRYNLTDHLGNVRATIYRNPNTNAVEVLQRDDYYPFGLQKFPNPIYGNNKYLYNGKEKQEELGGQLDYGARFYDPVIGRWSVVDPLAEKYKNLSLYVYAANNPIIFIDPDGRDIIFAQRIRDDGTTVITMTVNGKLINESGKAFTSEQMNDYATRLSGVLKDYYGVNGDKFEVNVVANITVATEENKLGTTDHAFRIVDDGKIPDSSNPGGFRPEGVIGHAAFGELGIYINAEIVNDNKPAITGTYSGTGKTATGDATLERTGTHELGHTGTLSHPTQGAMNGNLMHQTGQPNAGSKITKEQILKMKEAYDKGKLNKGRQSY
ncbi:RHS repeat domain-containing protein [Sphingobacterium spiritivorum]|uniref:RHS repeat domain-containing protein n=1 Tax=Sphingobacterium spiritivorum TaxID=258 RepID=UPI003DA5EDA8